MAEYIEREELLKRIRWASSEDEAIISVRRMPTADVAPVIYANWKYYHKENIAVCTNCSFERDLDVNFGKAISCPNCGARMDRSDYKKC